MDAKHSKMPSCLEMWKQAIREGFITEDTVEPSSGLTAGERVRMMEREAERSKMEREAKAACRYTP